MCGGVWWCVWSGYVVCGGNVVLSVSGVLYVGWCVWSVSVCVVLCSMDYL